MSTRSFIGKQNPNGTFTCIYCHWEGQPSINGAILLDHYQNPSKIDELLALGDLSILGSQIGEAHDFNADTDDWCKAYGRDRGDENAKAVNLRSLSDVLTKAESRDAKYVYVFMNNQWHFSPRGAFLRLLTTEDCAE